MTCIVAVKQDGIVYFGADSAGVGEDSMLVVKTPKLFKKGPMIFGYTSSFRMGQLLGYALRLPDHPEDMSVECYMCTEFINEVRMCFDSGGFSQESSNGQELGGVFLVGYKGLIFRVEEDFEVLESIEDFDSVGSGQDLALGSLDATHWMNPHQRLRMALETAQKFSPNVRGPFNFMQSGIS